MFLIFNQIKFRVLTIVVFFASLISGCSDEVKVFAICNDNESRIIYSEQDYQRLLRIKNCEKCKLNGINANLSNLDLSEANISSTELAGANLSGTNLTGANLNRVIFSHHDGGQSGTGTTCIANLQGANLESVNLTNANLEQANLQK